MSTETNHDSEKDSTPIETTLESPASSERPEKIPNGDKTMAMLCHLLSFVGLLGVPIGNILGPLVIWLVKKDQDPFVDATGKEVLNFQITATIYGIICGLLVFVVIGLFLLPVLIIAVVVLTIIGALKANEGILYRYPFTIRFLK
ncbi:DUF4870 domain-containing protein [Coraliomargarita sp. SDUM461004]|uniref:DUF4870 domain-containing protein n=2 Tax=Thalassobacterium sedimentorum TaxID=3041258 RepID=A0ABU1AFW9_9BACT|nr:DUF4870 domain-containing protein [Coraliomargarita sp. SDUM461004]MDQ8193459.1 DUF4870 domain-containing protein [Coraliomargarita sp. SDUM461004]